MKRISLLLAVLTAIPFFAAPPVAFKNTATAWKVLKKNAPAVAGRSAYIRLVSDEKEREKAWIWALTCADPVLRRDAVGAYFRAKGEAAVEKMLAMKPEEDELVRPVLIDVIRQIKSAQLRRRLAAKVVGPVKQPTKRGELFRANTRLKDDLTYDHEVETFRRIPLAGENWKFRTDKENQGVKKKFFAPDLDESAWKKISVEKNWEVQGFPDYDGYGWYRVSFKMPEKKEAAGAEFCFPLVDEEAWIWLNGVYLGQRADGPDAWNKPFYMDASKEVLWGKVNQLTIRVFDSCKAGGICRPPQLHLLR